MHHMWKTTFDNNYVGLIIDGVEWIVTQTKIMFIGQPSTPLHNFLVVIPLELSLDVAFVRFSHINYICDFVPTHQVLLKKVLVSIIFNLLITCPSP
jgi:hypothetical protein